MHRLGQAFLCLAHPLQRIAEIAIFQQNGQIPQRLGNLILGLIGQAAVRGQRLQTAQDHPQSQIGGVRAEQAIFGRVRDRAQHLRHAAGVGSGPQQIAALFDHGGGQRIKEPPCRQGHLLGLTTRQSDRAHH